MSKLKTAYKNQPAIIQPMDYYQDSIEEARSCNGTLTAQLFKERQTQVLSAFTEKCRAAINQEEALKPDLVSDTDFKSIPLITTNELDSLDNGNYAGQRAFLFIDAEENLQIATPELFCKKLKCNPEDKIKVISIFGNTGDGKSHTMNQVFFGGESVFRTSTAQDSCTVGVYAALQPELGVLCLDTEGLLGTAAKTNKRMRMLLKILAISDIVIYRTRSERLHSDMYEFLGNASKAFCLHFTQALQAMGNGSTMGPAVIIFHETHHTKPLENSVEESAEDKLRNNFALLNYETNAFSSLRYVGIQTDANKATNFQKIRDALRFEIENTAVRSPRQPDVVFRATKLLNQKFSGDLEEKAINPFLEQYFTCPEHCESCTQRCQRSMGHVSDGEPHFNARPCNYQHQFENKEYLCKTCYNNGKEIVVTVRAQAQTDTPLSGLAKYVWKGDVIECVYCGEIYRTRQFWYGNKSPEATAVRVQVVHVWKGGNLSVRGNTHSAQMMLDGVSYVSEAITSISAPSTKALSDWMAAKVAPSYWRPNQEIILCHACKRNFEKTGLPKHHCRGCGEGFCHTCSQHELPVPARGWVEPVRVCNDCYQQLQCKADALPAAVDQAAFNQSNSHLTIEHTGSRPTNDDGDILPRKYGEVIYNTISSVASLAIVYPKEIIKNSARPSYWVPDAESPKCFICKDVFGNAEELALAHHSGRLQAQANGKVRGSSSNGHNRSQQIVQTPVDCKRHHCRRCGQAVCSNCSKTRTPVPERGWQTDVRVCDSCARVPKAVTSTGNAGALHEALSDAINCETTNALESSNGSRRGSSNEQRNSNGNSNASDDAKAKTE